MIVNCFVCGKTLNVKPGRKIYTCSNDCSEILKILESVERENVTKVLKDLSKIVGVYNAKELLNRYIAYSLALKIKDFDGILKDVRRRDAYTYEVTFYRIEDFEEVVIPIAIYF